MEKRSGCGRTGVMRRHQAKRHNIPVTSINTWVAQWRQEEAEPESIPTFVRGHGPAVREAACAEWLESGSPYAIAEKMGVGAVDRETGAITIVDEIYQRRLTNPEQAQEVLGVLDRWGIARNRISIYADPSMWAKKTDHVGRPVADVEAFHRLRLRFVKAGNSRRAGWQNVRRYLR